MTARGSALSAEDPAEAAGSELRAERRPRVLLRGKIAFGPQFCFNMDCTIRDLTAGGAHVRLPPGQTAADEVYLIELRDGVAHEAKLVWSRLPDLGLQFVARHDLQEAVPAHLRPLQRLWMGTTYS